MQRVTRLCMEGGSRLKHCNTERTERKNKEPIEGRFDCTEHMESVDFLFLVRVDKKKGP